MGIGWIGNEVSGEHWIQCFLLGPWPRGAGNFRIESGTASGPGGALIAAETGRNKEFIRRYFYGPVGVPRLGTEGPGNGGYFSPPEIPPERGDKEAQKYARKKSALGAIGRG